MSEKIFKRRHIADEQLLSTFKMFYLRRRTTSFFSFLPINVRFKQKFLNNIFQRSTINITDSEILKKFMFYLKLTGFFYKHAFTYIYPTFPLAFGNFF